MSDAPNDSFTQADIDAALAAAGLSTEAAATEGPAPTPDASGVKPAADTRVDAAGHAFDEAAAAMAAAIEAERASAPPPGAKPVPLPDLGADSPGPASAQNIDLLRDVNLHVKIELGRTRMLVEDVLRLGEGSVVELDKLAGDPVDVLVNERLVARGEVLVLNDTFCVRINEILSPVEEIGS